MVLAGKGLRFSQDVDSTGFSTNSSACSARPPPFPFLVASICPSTHGYSRDSRHSVTFTLFCFSFEKFHLGTAFPSFTLTESKFSAAPLGRPAGPCPGPCSAPSASTGESARGSVQCLAAGVHEVYQLALTASMSLTKFCARHIPKICSNAMPMKIPATMVKLSCSHFSNWGTQPFV